MKNIKEKIGIGISWGIAAIYIVVLVKLVIFKNGITNEFRGISMMPFSFLIDFAKGDLELADMLKNSLGNIGVFIPFGILVPLLFKRYSAKMSILIGMFTSIWIEIFQFISGLGLTDIDDVILNTVGASIGVCLYFKISRNIDKKFKNCFATLIMLCLIGIVSAGGLYYFGFGNNLVGNKITVVNGQVLGGLNPESEDVEASVKDIKDNQIIAEPCIYDEEGKKKDADLETYTFNSESRFFTKRFSYDYSPNGNIRSTTITYDEITSEELESILKENNYQILLWTSDDGKQCDDIIVIIREDK